MTMFDVVDSRICKSTIVSDIAVLPKWTAAMPYTYQLAILVNLPVVFTQRRSDIPALDHSGEPAA